MRNPPMPEKHSANVKRGPRSAMLAVGGRQQTTHDGGDVHCEQAVNTRTDSEAVYDCLKAKCLTKGTDELRRLTKEIRQTGVSQDKS